MGFKRPEVQIFSPRPRKSTATFVAVLFALSGVRRRCPHVTLTSARLTSPLFALPLMLRRAPFALPPFISRLTPFSRPFAIPSLRSLQIFSPRPERRGLNSSATLSYEIIAHSFRRSAYMPDRNNANPPQSNSFRRFCAVETCQYVYYCLRSARTKSSENLFL